MRRATIACSSRSFSERSSCSPRWSSTAGSALRRVEPASATVLARMALAAHQQLGAGGDERALAARRRRTRSSRGTPRAARRARAAASCGAAAWTCDLAGEHDLLELAGADPLDRARDRRLVVLGRHRADDDAARPDRRRVEQRQRRRCAARPARALQRAPAAPRARRRARRARRGSGARRSPRRASATSGTISEAGAKPAQCGAAPPSAANAKPPTATEPGAGGPSAGSRDGAARASSRQRAATAPKRSAPARLERSAARPAPPARRRAIGLLEAEPALAGPARGDTRSRSGRRRRPTRTVVAASTGSPGAGAARRREPSARRSRGAPRPNGRDGARVPRLGAGDAVTASCTPQVSPRPREIAISPVRTISIRPNGRTMLLERLDLLRRAGDLDDDRALASTSTTLPRKISAICMTSPRAPPSAATLNSASSRGDRLRRARGRGSSAR